MKSDQFTTQQVQAALHDAAANRLPDVPAFHDTEALTEALNQAEAQNQGHHR